MMINLFNLKNSIIAWAFGVGAFLLLVTTAILKIRQGGANAQLHKQTQATLENVAKAKKVQDDVNAMSDDAKRDELFRDFTRK
ncbi:MAG: hypothetical protein ACKO96_04870 [Flammeovirgaceae bacterium]